MSTKTLGLELSAPSTWLLNLALGILLGLIFGIAAALITESIDPRVRGNEELVELLSAPLIGELKPSSARITRDQRRAPVAGRMGAVQRR